ncbi:MAG: hypothetical protein GWP10_05465 [Nitrospiraceae bacterium]|nr:hypothetical protein [Nitrospiraceae bacterium]
MERPREVARKEECETMKKVAASGLVLMLVVLASLLVLAAQTTDQPLRVYTFADGSGVILYDNITGAPQDDLVLQFDNPVKILTDESFVIGGGAIVQFRDILGDGTYWGIYTGGGKTLKATDFCQPGGTFQIYFQSVDKPAKVIDSFLG